MKTVLEVVDIATSYLNEKGVKNPRREALDLLSHILTIRPLDLYVQYDRPMQEEELDRYRTSLRRRGKGEPFQYICGEMEFFNCKLLINSNVLIPRQETEILVDKIVKELSGHDLKGKVLWDLCCGSGCIGIALKKALPDLSVTLTDISTEALAVAKLNAERNHVDVEFLQGDFLAPLAGRKANYIVCNPPYVRESEFAELENEVRNYEPTMALVAGENGLRFYRELAENLPNYLLPKGQLWLEIGHQQGQEVQQLFQHLPTSRKELMQDWAAHDRFFFLELEA